VAAVNRKRHVTNASTDIGYAYVGTASTGTRVIFTRIGKDSAIDLENPLRNLRTYIAVDGMGASEAEGLVLQNDSWVASVGEHSRW
jgi:hypothetical protein